MVVNGGLARTKCMDFNSLQFAIAHELGHLYGGEPTNEFNYSCEGQSDYIAITGVLMNINYGTSAGPIVKSSISTMETFFNLISEELRKGKPGNRCMYISTDCRLATMRAAIAMENLPECAGGPADPSLTVDEVDSHVLLGGAYIEVHFNEEVDPASANVIGNYGFNPPLQANSARIDPKNPKAVKLSIAVPDAGHYVLCAYDIYSKDGAPLIEGKNCGSFTFN